MLYCPKYHRIETMVGQVEYTCDECRRGIRKREIVLECIRCDWSLCLPCAVEMRSVEAWAQWANDQMNIVFDQGPGTHEPDAENFPGEAWEQWTNDQLDLLLRGVGEPEPDAENSPTNLADMQEETLAAQKTYSPRCVSALGSLD